MGSEAVGILCFTWPKGTQPTPAEGWAEAAHQDARQAPIEELGSWGSKWPLQNGSGPSPGPVWAAYWPQPGMGPVRKPALLLADAASAVHVQYLEGI